MSKHPRWSKTKKRVEELFAPGLDLAIFSTVYTDTQSCHDVQKIPRHWITLNKEVIWDFPGHYFKSNNPDHPAAVRYHIYSEPYFRGIGQKSAPASVLRQYLDCPVSKLLEARFEDDHWDLGDMMRAADRRLGYRNLMVWGLLNQPAQPVRDILRERFTNKV